MNLIGCPVTGQTPLYASQMQPWAVQHFNKQDLECYCLDAPAYVPSGATHHCFTLGGVNYARDNFINRED